MNAPARVGIRWTVGNVHPCGFEALRLSIHGAWKLFGPAAEYVVCVNSISLNQARILTGEVPACVVWRDVTDKVPGFIRERLAPNMAEGVGWKFAPLCIFPDCFELALDNDCILWDLPRAIRGWLAPGEPPRTVIAADVRRMFGKFADLCGPEPCNSGIRGLPPGFDFEGRLREQLDAQSLPLDSELDEQGLQVAAVTRGTECLVVDSSEVAICSPFPPHQRKLGACGAHFVGLNAWRLPWKWYDRPAEECTREHWIRLREQVAARVQVASPRCGEVLSCSGRC